MDGLGKLDLMGVSTLAATAFALVLASVASVPVTASAVQAAPREASVTLTSDGQMKLTVLAPAARRST